MVTIMDITMAMATKGITTVFTPAVSAMVVITTMVMVAMAVTMDKVKVSKVVGSRGMCKMVVCLKGNII